MKLSMTWSPSLMPRTAAPAAITTAVDSCPSIVGTLASGLCSVCSWVWQMPLAKCLTNIWVGSRLGQLDLVDDHRLPDLDIHSRSRLHAADLLIAEPAAWQ